MYVKNLRLPLSELYAKTTRCPHWTTRHRLDDRLTDWLTLTKFLIECQALSMRLYARIGENGRQSRTTSWLYNNIIIYCCDLDIDYIFECRYNMTVCHWLLSWTIFIIYAKIYDIIIYNIIGRYRYKIDIDSRYRYRSRL